MCLVRITVANYSFRTNHKIVAFGFVGDDIAGKYLDRTFLDDPQRPPDELFRWHF